MSKTNQTKSDVKFNTTVTAMFQTYSGNFMTQNLTAERIEEIQEAVQELKVGNALMLKQSKKLNSAGKPTFFLEICDPSTFKKRETDDL